MTEIVQMFKTAYDEQQVHFDAMVARSKIRQNKCHFAVSVAVKRGIMGVCRFNPMLDVGCGNPYLGLYRFLKRFNWDGLYVGIDTKVPKEAVEWYDGEIKIKTCQLDGARLPLPPSLKDPTRYFPIAYCIDTMQKIKNKDLLVAEMQRVADQVVIVGGVTEQELRAWDFQRIGCRRFDENLIEAHRQFVKHTKHGSLYLPHDGVEYWGIWMSGYAEGLRRRMDTKASQVIGFFETDDPKQVQKRLFNCSKCGKTEISGNVNFECKHCHHINREVVYL